MKLRLIDKLFIAVVIIILFLYGSVKVYGDLTATEGFGIDMSSAGAGTDFTVAFDPTEITGGTIWDDGADASVIWTWDLSGTDPTLTFGSGLVTVGGGLTTTLDLIVTGGDITLGTTSIFSGGDVASLNNIDAIDATTETTLEAAIDALANLVTTGTITTGVWNAGAVTSSGAITATSGMDLGTSQALVGTTAMTIGNNAQTVAINSSDWDISTTGTLTNTEWQGTAIADAYVPNNITIDLATLATTLTITDNEATAENNPIVFVAGGDLDGGNLGLETDGDAYYTPSTGVITATGFAGALTGNVTGDVSGTAATVTGAAQAAITSLGTLTTLTVDDITINGNTISSAGASTLAINPTAGQTITFDGVVTLDAGVIAGATSVTSTAFVGALTGNADTVTTNANLTGDVTSVGNAATIAAASVEFGMVDNTITLAGNPALAASEAWFGTTGIIFEGSTADTIETLLTVTDPTATDKTITFQNVTGTVYVTGGTDVADADVVDALTLSTVSGAVDMGAATSLEVPNSATPTTNAAGEIALDTTITDHQPLLQYYDGGENMTVIAIDTSQLPALDNEIVKYDAASDKFVLEADAGAAGGDSISIDSVAVVDPDFVSTGDIDFVDTANTVTANLNADVVDEAHIADNGIDSEHYNDGSIDLVHLAAGVYAKDIVTTSPVTGATDNVLVGADSDVTIALDFTTNWDFSGGDLELPQASPAAPDADGEVEVDFTDGSVVVQHGSAHAELGTATDVVVGKLIKTWSATFATPDSLQSEIDNWMFKRIDASEFPHGVVITEVTLTVSSNTSYTINVENWDDFDTINGANPTIDAVAYTADTTGEVTEDTITYGTIGAGQIIMIDLPTTDVSWINISIQYYEPIA
jgi:hypothetical protein